MKPALMRVVRSVWQELNSEFDYEWLPGFLERQSLTLIIRRLVGLIAMGLGICAALVAFSRQRPESTAALVVVVVISIHWTVKGAVWLRNQPWPEQRSSLAFCAVGTASLVAFVAVGFRSSLVSVFACGLFITLGFYVTLLHSLRVVIAYEACVIGATLLVFLRAVLEPGADILFLIALEGVVLGMSVLPPAALFVGLVFLKRDAATSRRDALTDLMNRRGLYDSIGGILKSVSSDRALVTIVCDLNGFKLLNDGKGHAAGDAALQSIADRLRLAVPAGAAIGRLGGDEFVVLQSADETQLMETIERIRSATSIVVEGVSVSASVGVCVRETPIDGWADESEVLDGCVRIADQAMYEAKRSGSGFVVREASGL